ncbi:MAG TPA: phosphoribosylamine--glycine ligase [Thermoanaerobaculia bacterium]|nr:phosphoribosylamine--glycine ligase [Thermoanaerobaculia bacterium]
MNVLVVGGGGREHALCWKLRQSPLLKASGASGKLYCAPGNPGIAEVAERVPIGVEEVQRLADFAVEREIGLTVVGPELPLTLGLADELANRGLAVFGPTQRAAEIEGSKVFAKEFMARHGIPTAPFTVAHDAGQARELAGRYGYPVVLKADGLAAGKGVLIANDAEEYEDGVRALWEERRFGASADRVVVEAFLSGEEISFMVLSDGERILPLATARDYKLIGDGDTGPNTGGMGCHSPSGGLAAEAAAGILETVMYPAVRGLASEGRPFVGVLYAGLMMTEEGPRVLEFNARFGDPEAQVLMLRLEDDLLAVLASGAAGRFEVPRLTFRREAAACVVLASPGYPGTPVQGEPIRGLDRAGRLPGVEIFHAGTALSGGELVSAGGRVLSVCGVGEDLREALRAAYAAAAEVDWPAKVYRRDIGRRVVEQRELAGSW